MKYLRANGMATLVLAAAAIGCGGGRFTSGGQENAVVGATGGTSAILNSGGFTASTITGGNTSTNTGASNIGGASATGGIQGIAVDGAPSGGANAGGTPAFGGTGDVSGGAQPFGGHVSTGGATATTGGAIPTGGTPGSGGTISTSGAIPTGGTTSSGGTTSTGGAVPTGGTTSSGSTISTGGEIPTGGTPSSGGSIGAGGANTSANTSATGGQSSVTLTFGERPGASCQSLTNETSLNSETPNLNYGLAELFGCDTNPHTVALLRFNLANCDSVIDSRNQVLAVRLHLHTGTCTGCQASDNTTVQLFELLEGWDEGSGSDTGDVGTANWNESSDGVQWSGAGASGASQGTVVLAELGPTALNTDYVVTLPAALVQRWLDQPDTNAGVLLKISSTATSASDGVSFGASDGNSYISPLLEIDFAAL